MIDETEIIEVPLVIRPIASMWVRVMQSIALLKECKSADEAINQIMAMEVLKSNLAELSKMIEKARQEFGVDQVEKWGRDSMMPYYVGDEKTTKCRDAKALLARLLEVSDMDTIASLLSSDPWKQGACKAVLGEEWDKHFDVETKGKLKESEGQVAQQKKLMKLNTFNQ